MTLPAVAGFCVTAVSRNARCFRAFFFFATLGFHVNCECKHCLCVLWREALCLMAAFTADGCLHTVSCWSLSVHKRLISLCVAMSTELFFTVLSLSSLGSSAM